MLCVLLYLLCAAYWCHVRYYHDHNVPGIMFCVASTAYPMRDAVKAIEQRPDLRDDPVGLLKYLEDLPWLVLVSGGPCCSLYLGGPDLGSG